jgi:excisionase family DNA binding protein
MVRSQELLTVREVAELFRITPSTVCAWAKSGRIPAVRIGHTLRFPRAALAALVVPHKRARLDALARDDNGGAQ